MSILQNGRVCRCCKRSIQRDVLDANLSVCPYCGYYMRFHAKKRIMSLADKHSFREWDVQLKHSNPLGDEHYAQKLEETTSKFKLDDAILTGEMKINGYHTAIGVMDTRFMMASMGYVVGEKVTRLFERARRKKFPVIMFCCSGGARMQEGIISLMQMEKTSAAVKRHSDAGLLFVSILTNPTMGGVTASFATLADIILAEKGAMVGFAGERVITQNTGAKLPEGFQTAEFQHKRGFVDYVIERKYIRDCLAYLLKIHCGKGSIKIENNIKLPEEYIEIEESKTAWEKVKIARSKDRPTSKDYIYRIFTNFMELSGDRATGDDSAIVAGVAEINGHPVTVVGQQKGKNDLQEAIYRNWGMASPSGYRKALRLIKQAEKFRRPVVCLVDTIGASCNKEAEEFGQGWIIASMLEELSTVSVPILSIVISEGGSGGALALAVGNEVWMLENAVYSILTPEAYASIIWKNNLKAPEAAEIMKMEAKGLYNLGVIDKIIYEREPVNVQNMDNVCQYLNYNISAFIEKYKKMKPDKIIKARYSKFRKF